MIDEIDRVCFSCFTLGSSVTSVLGQLLLYIPSHPRPGRPRRGPPPVAGRDEMGVRGERGLRGMKDRPCHLFPICV